MITQQHSRIQSSQYHSAHSDLQSLRNHLQPLPHSQPNHLNPSSETGSWSPDSDEQSKNLMSKVISQVHELLKLRQEVYYYKTEFFRMSHQYQTLKTASSNFDKQHHKFDSTLQNLQRELTTANEQKEQLVRQLEQKDKDIQMLHNDNLRLKSAAGHFSKSLENQLNEEIQKQSQIIMDLMVKNQKIMKINSFLKEQLSIAEKKLVSLEMETQEKTYGLLFKNLERLKENRDSNHNKDKYQLSNWQTEDPPRTFQGHASVSPIEKQQTLKLTSREQKYQGELKYRRESKTVEKEKAGLRSEKEKLKPVEEPKPQRKGQVGDPHRKYQRDSSWWGENK